MFNNIKKDWNLCNQFVELMSQYEKDGTIFNDLQDNTVWLVFVKCQKDNMKYRPISFISIVLLHTLFHFRNIQKSQKYYSNGFGKPCEI